MMVPLSVFALAICLSTFLAVMLTSSIFVFHMQRQKAQREEAGFCGECGEHVGPTLLGVPPENPDRFPRPPE